MKFRDLPYERPDKDVLLSELKSLVERFRSAESAAEQAEIFDEYNTLTKHVSTLATIASIRHTIDTRDSFYDAENEFFDETSPLLEELEQEFGRAMLASEFRPQLEEKYGSLLFKNLEISARSFKPEMIELMQQENRLMSRYQKLYASAVVEFDGRTIPLPMLGPYKESTDRSVRRRAYEVEGSFFDSHRDELDELYDELIKNRTAQAKMLGYDNYIQLGYDRLGRNCYGPEKVAAFRRQIAEDIVPIVSREKEKQRQRLGVDKLKYYDDNLLLRCGNAKPEGSAEDILAAGLEMYHSLSPETASFIDVMYENELLDVLSRDGKAPGGYCTELLDYNSCFIFSNFNATSDDVDVLTHEAGHAFAGFRAMEHGYIPQLIAPTYEACECHSMSMEFLTAPYHHLFFGKNVKKYEYAHAASGLIFIPYGCMVDEFQYIAYERPELTPDERNEIWLGLEKKYRPWIDHDGLPFYSRGAGWQRQLHIYLDPFYYIDYCMAQAVAFCFWLSSMENREETWRKYLDFADKGGAETFEQLVLGAGFELPYTSGCMKAIGERVAGWLDANEAD